MAGERVIDDLLIRDYFVIRTIFVSASTLTPLLQWPLKGYLLSNIYIYILDDQRQLAKSFGLT